MQILVVDDDAVFREELAELLRQEGHTADASPSVPKALEELARKDYDVVLTDLKMPRHSGLELLSEARKQWPRTLVVMITGFATVETAVQAMKAGAFDYIRKPFQIQQVRQVLGLAQQELQFQAGGKTAPDPLALAHSWVQKEGLEVLLITSHAEKVRSGVTPFVSESMEPARIGEVVTSFLATHPRAGVILGDGHLLLTGRRKPDVISFLSHLREEVDPHGPFVVSLDPTKLSGQDLSDIRAAVMASSTHATLEVLANPLRRAVIRRVAQGPCSFTQAMQAVGLDDSPKMSFHLRKLVEDGLMVHQDDDYRITPKGREAVDLLEELDSRAPARKLANAVLESRPAPSAS